jgi:AcrR family transcriptional regulator
LARVRTDEKRNEIVRVAADLFEKHGYDRCSMAALSERLGGSKATLYGYFPSKEDLLRAVLDFQVATDADRIMREFPTQDDLRESLILLGTAYLNKRTSSLPIANIRMVANQPAGSTMGRDFYVNIIQPAFERLAQKFEALMDEGRLRRADPKLAMMHWKGLCDWDFFERRLLGVIDGPDPKQIKQAATEAADAFLKLYGPAKKPARPKMKSTRTERTAR